MAYWTTLKAAIANVIKTNGNQEITGQLLQNVLNNIVSSVGENATFAGIATPATNPGVPDGNVFYLATEAGIYANFSGIEIAAGEAVILEWRGSWVKKVTGFATSQQLSELSVQIGNSISGKYEKELLSTPGKDQFLGYPIVKGRHYNIRILNEVPTNYNMVVIGDDGSKNTIFIGVDKTELEYKNITFDYSGSLVLYTSVNSSANTFNIIFEDLDIVTYNTIANMNSISGEGLSWEETYTPQTEGKIIYGAIKKGIFYRYNATYKDTGENIPVAVRGLDREGNTVEPFSSANGIFYFNKDIYGIKIYYGSQATVGATAVIKIDREDMFLSNEYSGSPKESILPFNLPVLYTNDKRFIIQAGDTVNSSINLEFIKYKNGKAYIPPRCYWYVRINLDAFGIVETSEDDILQAFVQADAQEGANYSISFDIDPLQSGIYDVAAKYKFTQVKKGFWAMLSKLNHISKSRYLRFFIDNRYSDFELEVGFLSLWKENASSHTTSGLLQSAIAKLAHDVSRMTILNICPDIKDFNINIGGSLEITGVRAFKFTSTETSSVIGFNFLCSEKQGIYPGGNNFGLYFETGNIVRNGKNVLFYIIYYNSNNQEISRSGIINFESNSKNKLYSDMPTNTHHIIVRFQVSDIGQQIEIKNMIILYGNDLYSSTDIFNYKNVISGIKTIKVGLDENDNENKLSLVYVDEANGNDNNSGISLSTAFRTFSKAFSVISNDATIMLNGDISQRFNIKTNSKQRSLRLIGISGKLNRILGGSKINSATLVEGNVYSTTLDSFPSDNKFQIFQHEATDESTLITSDKRHPLQRGKTYRCESSKLVRKTSLDEVKSSEELSFYYDTNSKTLYFKIKTGTNLSNNPIYIPSKSANIYGNDGTVKFEMSGIDSLYGAVSLAKCHGGKVMDCSARYAYGGGAFSMDNAIGLELIRCEATRAFSGTATGDGFNAHSTTGSSIDTNSKRTTATMIDCWSHDNNDDGYSDHEGCEVTIIGGLFENNVKGGLTPSYGAHDKYIGCYVRDNVNGGICHVGTAEDGGVGGQTECINCISESNSWNYGVANGTEENPNKLILINCISKKGKEGFKPFSTYDFIEMINCYDYESTTVKSGATQNISIKNAQLVE